MEEEQTTHAQWLEEYEKKNERVKIEQMKQHIDDASLFAQALVDSPMGNPADYDLLWTTWCIRRGIK